VRRAEQTIGGDENTKVDREFFPCGQGVGAINELIPAGELVRQFVSEAENVIDRLSAVRAR
jgi:enoyl-[acyl-carrier protein] reductase II